MLWPSMRLDQCCRIVSGATPSTGEPTYWDGNICWATPKDLSELDGPTISNTSRRITSAGLASCAAEVLPPGSVLFSSRAPIGYVAINSVPMATNQGFKSFIPQKGVLEPRFLYWWLKTNRNYLEGLGNGATFKELSKASISRVTIPVPPLADQRYVSDVLDHAESLLASRMLALVRLDELARAMFAEQTQGAAATSWKRVKLRDAYWFQEGPGVRAWQFTASGVKLLNVGNIQASGTLNLAKTTRYISEEEAHGRYSHFLADAGDLVIASSGVSFAQDGLLRTRGAFVAPCDLPLCMNTSTIRFKAKAGISDLRYLHSWLDSVEFRSQITRLVTGTAQQNFGPSHLSQLTITLPPLEIQRALAAKAEEVARARSVQATSLRQLEALRACLQHRAFAGALNRPGE